MTQSPWMIKGGSEMKHIKNKKEFETLWNKSPALVCDFSASWCGPCRALEPALKKLEQAFPEAVFAKVDVDEQSELADKYDIKLVPTVIFVKKGKIVHKGLGAMKYEDLTRLVKKLCANDQDDS